MHINLFVGLIFLLALGWFVHEMRAHQKAKKAKPADLLKNDLEKRRAAQEQIRQASEHLAKLKATHAEKIMDVLKDMTQGLDGSSKHISVQKNNNTVELTLAYKDKEEVFYLEWNIKNFNMELLSDPAAPKHTQGEYIIRMPGGSMLPEPDLASFTRTISGLIADRLA